MEEEPKYNPQTFENAYLGGFQYGSAAGKMYNLENIEFDQELAVQQNMALLNIGGDVDLLMANQDPWTKPKFIKKHQSKH